MDLSGTATAPPPSSSVMLLCSFEAADALFALPASQVREVLRYREHTQVPLTNDVVHGLMNLRGEIVTTIDLRCRLGGRPEKVNESMSLIVLNADVPVSLLVDRISDIIELRPETMDPMPTTVSAHLRQVSSGVFQLEHALLVLLDLERLLDHASMPNNPPGVPAPWAPDLPRR